MFKFNEELMAFSETNKEVIIEDYKRIYAAVGNSNAVYKGKQLPFLYYPTLYSTKDYKVFEKITKDIFHIVNKSIDIFMNHPEVRYIWEFDNRLEALITVEHDYKANVPMGRFDFFYYPDGHYEFCELNTDGTSAMNEETPLTDILLDTYALKEFQKKHKVKRFELYESWVDEVDVIYDEYTSKGHEKLEHPYVVVMDYMSKGSPHEFEEFKTAFIKRGYKCDIVSPDDLKHKDGYLYYEDVKIDIIYRRLVTRDLMDQYDQLSDLVQGILANKTCIIGTIKSQIVHTKKYFEALHNDEVRRFFTDEELIYIDKHIPYTAPLRLENIDRYIDDKDQYIIKPIDFYASKGVYAGKEFSTDAWRTHLIDAVKTGYIIQKFCKKSINKNLYFKENGDFEIREVNNITGLFVYNEKLSGIFTRAGFNAVISDLNDGYSLSSVVVEE